MTRSRRLGKGRSRLRGAPAVVVAGAAGFAGVVAMHTGGTPSMLGSSGPIRPVTTTTGAPGGASTTTPLPTAPSVGLRTAVGASEQYGYGVLSVKVTEQAGHITDVSVASIQTAEQYSQSLAQQVIPMLKSEVLSAQSAHINAVSGATYTSEAYAYSVQSALDTLKAH